MPTAIRSLLLCVLLCLTAMGGAHAQGAGGRLPDAPSAAPQASPASAHQASVVFHKKAFWTLVGVDAASAIADAQTSWNDLQTNAGLHEQNSWLYGKRPGLARYYLTDAVIDGGSALLSYKLLHSRRKLLRATGWVLLGAVIAGHTEGWIYNETVKVAVATPPAR